MSAIKYVPKGQILVVADCNNDAATKKKNLKCNLYHQLDFILFVFFISSFTCILILESVTCDQFLK